VHAGPFGARAGHRGREREGGVGKTTIAVNLALALTAQGRRTGLIDADLYGPDVPRTMGLRRRAEASS
jgi:ATP-binding protein involved in chromosome partitioning